MSRLSQAFAYINAPVGKLATVRRQLTHLTQSIELDKLRDEKILEERRAKRDTIN